jgi:hypothetical protein
MLTDAVLSAFDVSDCFDLNSRNPGEPQPGGYEEQKHELIARVSSTRSIDLLKILRRDAVNVAFQHIAVVLSPVDEESRRYGVARANDGRKEDAQPRCTSVRSLMQPTVATAQQQPQVP